MRKLTIFLMSLLLVALTACQSTPDTAPVVSRRENIISEDFIKPRGNLNYDAPCEVNGIETIEAKNMRIEAAAPVEIPDAATFPVCVVERTKFGDMLMNKLIKTFSEENALYFAPEAYTKAELERFLLEVKQDGLPETYTQGDLNAIISILEQEIQQAPDKADKEYVSDSGMVQNRQTLDLAFDTPDGATFEIAISRPESNFILRQANAFVQREEMLEQGETLGEIPIAEAAAIAKSQDALADLDLDGFALADCMPARLLAKKNPYALTTSQLSAGYSLCYMRKQSELYVPYIGRGVGGTPGYAPDYSTPWPQERIELYIDESGIKFFALISLCNVKEIVEADALLLDFDQILGRMYRQLEYKYAWSAKNAKEEYRIQVNKILLGLSVAQIKYEMDAVLLLPTWYIFHSHGVDDIPLQNDVIALNAIDGGCVEPRIPTAVLSIPCKSEPVRKP